MSTPRPTVFHPDGTPGSPLPDVERQTWRDAWASWIVNDAGDVSGWHHHAANDTYVYVLRGLVTIEFGPDGAESIVASAGDFFHVPPHTVHRETTGQDVDLDAFVLRTGGEPEHVNVEGPEAAAE
jgi:uncharacterized RmlC-like cupin family protein